MSTPSQMSPDLIINLIKELKATKLYADLHSAALIECENPQAKIADLNNMVTAGLSNAGWEKKLRNTVFTHLQQRPACRQSPETNADFVKEPIPYIKKAQVNWEKRIVKSLNSMSTELALPLARQRGENEQKDLISKWSELGIFSPDLSQIRPVYAPKDFLEVVIALQNPNFNTSRDAGCTPHLGVVQTPLRVKDIHELRFQYSEMSINQCQTGVDDQGDMPPELFDADRTKLAYKVVKEDHVPVSQMFSRRGCPASVRAQLWCQMLNVSVTEYDRLYYEQLKSYVIQHELLVDNLLYKDVKLTATNDDQYFVFEDYLYQVLLPFSRDTTVLQHFTHNSASPTTAFIQGHYDSEEYRVTYPPNGVIPFHGFAMYVAPLAYLFSDPVTLYFVFRELYTRYLFRLHSVSSHPQGIVSLSLLFETLLQTQEADLFYHLRSVSCQPLKIAFKWLVRAFSGYLSSDQVLLLWDRILAYNSLEILPVLAVAIFSFRKTNLMKVLTLQAAEAVLADLTTLQVIPLTQLTLFSK